MIGALVAGITGSGGASLSSYESIATATGTGSSATITFSSIPSGFKHLQIRGIGRTAAALTLDNTLINFNGDSGSNYAWHLLQGNGSTAAAAGFATRTFGAIYSSETGASAAANIMATTIIDILDYGSTSKYKTVRSFAGADLNGSGQVTITSSLWQSTSAITSIVLTGNGNWTTASTFALYGIKEA